MSCVLAMAKMRNWRYHLGGSAFILLGKLTRATHDIDVLSVPKELYTLLGKYDINRFFAAQTMAA